jgi:hypothetical protein
MGVLVSNFLSLLIALNIPVSTEAKPDWELILSLASEASSMAISDEEREKLQEAFATQLAIALALPDAPTPDFFEITLNVESPVSSLQAYSQSRRASFKLNDQLIQSLATDDLLSHRAPSLSAISLSSGVNRVGHETGVYAYPLPTQVWLKEISEQQISELQDLRANEFQLNGILIEGSIRSLDDLVEAINRQSEETGVEVFLIHSTPQKREGLAIDDEAQKIDLLLVARDGRNIDIHLRGDRALELQSTFQLPISGTYARIFFGSLLFISKEKFEIETRDYPLFMETETTLRVGEEALTNLLDLSLRDFHEAGRAEAILQFYLQNF